VISKFTDWSRQLSTLDTKSRRRCTNRVPIVILLHIGSLRLRLGSLPSSDILLVKNTILLYSY